jgi:protocatechuate 3,4-dioxygenase beta subunit
MTDDHGHDTEPDDRHDLGLLFDLHTLRRRATALAPDVQVGRRGALKLLVGAGAGLALAACGSSGATSSGSSSTASSAAGGASTSVLGSSTTTGSTGAIPGETAGPYPGDGSNGPDVLTESGVVRQDITSSFGPYSGTAEGVPLTIDLTVVDAASGEPWEGAAVYLWHCDRDGGYSLYSQGVEDQNYLRGVQEAAAGGTLRFTSIYPAAYDGRWPHIHFEVFPSLSDATSAGSRLVTSQLALPQDTSEAVYATSGYEQSVQNLARTSLDTDMVFSDGYDQQLAAMSGDTSGMTATLTVAV